ncbi:hypothetical protein ACS0X5_36420 [Burkholderia gladioli]
MNQGISLHRAGARCAWMAATLVAMAGGGHVMAKEDRPPVVLDTQTGIHDGRSGVVLQTAPLNPAPIVAPAQIRQPAQLPQDNQQTPLIVAPYIRVPTDSGPRR